MDIVMLIDVLMMVDVIGDIIKPMAVDDNVPGSIWNIWYIFNWPYFALFQTTCCWIGLKYKRGRSQIDKIIICSKSCCVYCNRTATAVCHAIVTKTLAF